MSEAGGVVTACAEAAPALSSLSVSLIMTTSPPPWTLKGTLGTPAPPPVTSLESALCLGAGCEQHGAPGMCRRCDTRFTAALLSTPCIHRDPICSVWSLHYTPVQLYLRGVCNGRRAEPSCSIHTCLTHFNQRRGIPAQRSCRTRDCASCSWLPAIADATTDPPSSTWPPQPLVTCPHRHLRRNVVHRACMLRRRCFRTRARYMALVLEQPRHRRA